MTLDEQIKLALAALPKERKRFIVVPKRPKAKGGGKRRMPKRYGPGSGPGPRGGHGRRVGWQHSRLGWDALLWDSHGHVLNAINYGLPNPPTEGQKREAERLLLSSVNPRSPLNRRGGGKRRSPRLNSGKRLVQNLLREYLPDQDARALRAAAKKINLYWGDYDRWTEANINAALRDAGFPFQSSLASAIFRVGNTAPLTMWRPF